MKKMLKTDLERFEDLFGKTGKLIKPGRKMFRVIDLDSQIAEARLIINANHLKVTLVNDADMASYRCFEVIQN